MTHDNQKTIREELTSLLNSWIHNKTWGGGNILDEEKDMDKIMKVIQSHHQKELEELKKEVQALKNSYHKLLKFKDKDSEVYNVLFWENKALDKVSQLIDQRLSVKENR